ncbi:MAG TPA: DUF2934 domain-containing protein [Rhodopila sp.]
MPESIQAFEERVRERAYFLWLRAGEPPGLADEFWAAARSAEDAPNVPGRSELMWPDVSTRIVKEENVKLLLERADAMIKAQDDGLRAMEGRMASLLGINVTLGTAAIAAEITALGTSPTSLPWVQTWTIPTLSILTAFWVAAILVAAAAMMARKWTVPGVSPINLYRATFLTQNTNRLRMNLAKTLQEAIVDNKHTVDTYARRLKAVVLLLAGGPVAAALAAAWFTRALWLTHLGVY